MIVQCKGKDLSKIPASKLQDTMYLASIKYDGNYVQINKVNNNVEFITSGGHQFYIKELADYLIENNRGFDFVIETEYIGNTTGAKGCRGDCTTTTWRTDFKKGLPSKYNNEKFKVFDILYYDVSKSANGDTAVHKRTMHNYHSDRWNVRQFINFPLPLIEPVKKHLVTLEEAQTLAKGLYKQGWEGMVLVAKYHKYEPGKRVNDIIKLKQRPTADLKCIDIQLGEGKYTGMIGSLLLCDVMGRNVSVGSGLSDADRLAHPDEFIGKIVEIEYEQILDTYTQPVFKGVRYDKTSND